MTPPSLEYTVRDERGVVVAVRAKTRREAREWRDDMRKRMKDKSIEIVRVHKVEEVVQ